MQSPISKMEPNQPFCFACSPQVSCFNACCRDLNQALTPYDVLCLKQFLKVTSADFLNAYTQASTGPGTGLPVVSLRFDDAHDRTCPFVTPAGCRVYPARPASCRTYPLARGVSRNRTTGQLTEQWALIREPHCLGHHNGDIQTVDQWIDEQQLATHNHMNDLLLELISLKNRFHPGPLKPADYRRTYTALYDLDNFYRERQADRLVPSTTTGPPTATPLENGALQQLRQSMTWVRDNIFNAPPQELRP
jgi:hypothetical protein